jgi:hypothetical protein
MNEWVVVGVLLALVGLRVMAVGVLALFIIRPVRGCPACFQDTAPLRKRWLTLVSRRMEWRWCPACGWEGLARRIRGRGGRPLGPVSGRHEGNPPGVDHGNRSGLDDGEGPGS